MTNMELAEEIEQRTKYMPECGLEIDLPTSAWQQIIAALRRGPEREGFYEKLWKDFVSLQRGDAQDIIAKVEAYYRERPLSGERYEAQARIAELEKIATEALNSWARWSGERPIYSNADAYRIEELRAALKSRA